MSCGVAFSQFLQPQTGLLQQVRVFMSVKLREEGGKGENKEGEREEGEGEEGREGGKEGEREEG